MHRRQAALIVPLVVAGAVAWLVGGQAVGPVLVLQGNIQSIGPADYPRVPFVPDLPDYPRVAPPLELSDLPTLLGPTERDFPQGVARWVFLLNGHRLWTRLDVRETQDFIREAQRNFEEPLLNLEPFAEAFAERPQHWFDNRPAVLPDEAILVVFPGGELDLMMRDAMVPLDVLFLNDDRAIVDIQTMAPEPFFVPEEERRRYRSRAPAVAALIVQGGLAQRLGFHLGMRVELDCTRWENMDDPECGGGIDDGVRAGEPEVRVGLGPSPTPTPAIGRFTRQ